MRVAIAGFSMESASLVPVLATIEDFEAQAIRGEALISQRRGTSTVIGGFINVCQAEAVEIVPLVATSGGAAGSASDAAFDQYVAEICDGLRALQGRIDGVLLDIHGAMAWNCSAASGIIRSTSVRAWSIVAPADNRATAGYAKPSTSTEPRSHRSGT